MESDRLKYVLGGILCIVLVLICLLSVLQQLEYPVKNKIILTVDFLLIAVSFTASIVLFRKGRKPKEAGLNHF